MSFISGLALVLLTLVGYSSGAVLGAKDKAVTPNILDLLVVLGLWIAALATRDTLGRWISIAIWMVLGLFLGMILARIRAHGYQKAQTVDTGKGLWNAWKGFAQRMGNYQSRVLMGFIYFRIYRIFVMQ